MVPLLNGLPEFVAKVVPSVLSASDAALVRRNLHPIG